MGETKFESRSLDPKIICPQDHFSFRSNMLEKVPWFVRKEICVGEDRRESWMSGQWTEERRWSKDMLTTTIGLSADWLWASCRQSRRRIRIWGTLKCETLPHLWGQSCQNGSIRLPRFGHYSVLGEISLYGNCLHFRVLESLRWASDETW